MNNANNWLLAIGIVILLGGSVWWLYGSDKTTGTNNNTVTTNTTTNNNTNTTEPVAKLATPVSSTDWTFGPADAKVQIVEYADYQCPACKALSPTFKAIAAKFPDQVSFTYRHFPLSYHELAQPAAEIAEAAGAQGKFWEMGDYLFANEFTIDSAYEHAATLGLDVEKMKSEVASGAYTEAVNQDYQSGVQSQVPGTPTLYLNGESLAWEKTQNLENTIKEILGQ